MMTTLTMTLEKKVSIFFNLYRIHGLSIIPIFFRSNVCSLNVRLFLCLSESKFPIKRKKGDIYRLIS